MAPLPQPRRHPNPIALSSDHSSHGTAPVERLLQRFEHRPSLCIPDTAETEALVDRIRRGHLHRKARPDSGEVIRQRYPVPSPLVVRANHSAMQVIMGKKAKLEGILSSRVRREAQAQAQTDDVDGDSMSSAGSSPRALSPSAALPRATWERGKSAGAQRGGAAAALVSPTIRKLDMSMTITTPRGAREDGAPAPACERPAADTQGSMLLAPTPDHPGAALSSSPGSQLSRSPALACVASWAGGGAAAGKAAAAPVGTLLNPAPARTALATMRLTEHVAQARAGRSEKFEQDMQDMLELVQNMAKPGRVGQALERELGGGAGVGGHGAAKGMGRPKQSFRPKSAPAGIGFANASTRGQPPAGHGAHAGGNGSRDAAAHGSSAGAAAGVGGLESATPNTIATPGPAGAGSVPGSATGGTRPRSTPSNTPGTSSMMPPAGLPTAYSTPAQTIPELDVELDEFGVLSEPPDGPLTGMRFRYVKQHVQKHIAHLRGSPDMMKKHDAMLKQKRADRAALHRVNHVKTNIRRTPQYTRVTAGAAREEKHAARTQHCADVADAKGRIDDAYLKEQAERAKILEADAALAVRARDRQRILGAAVVFALASTRLADARDAAAARRERACLIAATTLQQRFFPLFAKALAARSRVEGDREVQRKESLVRRKQKLLEEKKHSSMVRITHVLRLAVSCFPMRARMARHVFMEKIRRLQRFTRRLYHRKKFQLLLLDMQWRTAEAEAHARQRTQDLSRLKKNLMFYVRELEKQSAQGKGKMLKGGGGGGAGVAAKAAAAQRRNNALLQHAVASGRKRGGAAGVDPLAMSLVGAPPPWWTGDAKEFTSIATLTGMDAHQMSDADLRQLATDIGYLRPMGTTPAAQRRNILTGELHRRRRAFYRQVPAWKDRYHAWQMSQRILHASDGGGGGTSPSADGGAAPEPDLIQQQLLQMAGESECPQPPTWSIIIDPAVLTIWVRRAAAGELVTSGNL